MADWSKSMQQTFEYYTVDPGTWKDLDLLTNVKSCSITRDSESSTLGSASFNIVESIGECYVRVYLITIQNGVKEKYPLGTYLVQTPSSSFDGKTENVTLDAYTPLLELKETLPPVGYSLLKGDNIMERAYMLTRENVRAPVMETSCTTTLNDNFVAETDDTWLTFNGDLMANAKYSYDLDEMGRILFAPHQDAASLQPVWHYTDDNSSILYPELNIDHDLYGIPNVVEVVHSNGSDNFYARVVNDDTNSPVSTKTRGREIVHRETNPDLGGVPSEAQVKLYAEQLLRAMSTVEYTISYTHGYCPARVGDCVRITYEKANLLGVKAKVVSQTIKCEPGCPVTEKAVITTKLWR